MAAVDYRQETALVTGASSGIGAEFARQLAAHGADLVLVARREDRLHALADELRRAHDVRATVIPLDLSLPSAGETLAAEVARHGLTVTSLVNCAGFGTWGPFHEEDPQRVRNEISVDVLNLVDITRAFIAPLRASGTGVLINVASMAAYGPIPGMAVYAASKAFVLHFTEALWHESLGSGLRVLSLSPGATQTEFFEVIGTDAADGGTKRQSPQEVVAMALRTLDRRTPPPSILAGTANRIVVLASRLLSRRRVVLAAAAIASRGT